MSAAVLGAHANEPATKPTAAKKARIETDRRQTQSAEAVEGYSMTAKL
jgi:hypothetical protein